MSAASLKALILALAKAQRLPLHKLSLRADLDPSTMRKALRRGTKFRPGNLQDVARVLDVPYLQVLFEQEDITSADLQDYLNWVLAQRPAP